MMGLWILFLVSMVASLANCKKYPGSSSNRNWRESDVTKGASELSFHRGANGGISQKAFYTVNLSDNKKDNESRDCQEDETRHCNPITAGWNQFSPNEEKSLLVESREEETNRCNRSEFSLHCSQDDECRSPGVCQHISCHYPHVAEFRCPVLISPLLQQDSQFGHRSVFMTNTLAVILVGTMGNLLTLIAVPYVRIR